MRYRSQEAQSIHTALIQCIVMDTDNAYLAFEKKLAETSDSRLAEVSINHFSHLMDALHLPYGFEYSKEKAVKISLRLFKALEKRLKTERSFSVWAFLLAKGTNKNVNPLMQVLTTGEEKIIKAYLQALEDCIEVVWERNEKEQDKDAGYGEQKPKQDSYSHIVKTGLPEWRCPNTYVKLLTESDHAGFNCLLILLNSTKSTNLKLYLDIIKRCMRKGWLNNKTYAKLLTYTNKDGFTALHDAFKLDEAMFCLYLQEVKSCVVNKSISSANYAAFLTQATIQAAVTPLHIAFAEGSFFQCQFYLDTLQECLDKKWIEYEIYVKLLVSVNREGFTPLHEVLIAGNEDKLLLYISALKKCIELSLLEEKSYTQLLINKTHSGFNPLHQVLNQGNPANVKFYFKEINSCLEKSLLTSNEYVSLLTGRNNSNFTPLYDALKQGKPDNLQLYFQAIQNCLARNWYSKEAYKGLLTQINKAGYTPLHQVSISGNLASLKLYLEQILANLSEDEIVILLKARTLQGYLASASKRKPEAKEIDDYLNNLRKSYGLEAEAILFKQQASSLFSFHRSLCNQQRTPNNWRLRN